MGFEEALKALEEHIEILKQNLLFLMAEHNPESMRMTTQKIITIKRELDKAVQGRMKLSQIYYRHNGNVAVTCLDVVDRSRDTRLLLQRHHQISVMNLLDWNQI